MIGQPEKLKLAVLAGSGGGDFIALQKACSAGLVDFEVVAFITTSSTSSALPHLKKISRTQAVVYEDFAEKKQIYFAEVAAILKESHPDLILLSGFTFILPEFLVEAHEGKLVNSHHSLLPAHPGLFRKEKLLKAQDKFLGATLHQVDKGVDTGAILYQCVFPNPGMSGLDSALQQYRFAQDCMVVQLVMDQSGSERKDTDAFYNGIYFQPAIDRRVVEFFSDTKANLTI
jgi:phosphoribosylglycinamide formyltransferase-1